MYNNFAFLYDELMYDIDYKSWYLYIESIFDRFNKKPKGILEMGCGTGSLSYYLAKSGYDLTCFDISSEMLSIAYNKLNRFKNVNLLNQNMIDFHMNKKFDAVVSICDSINYIRDKDDLLNVFKNVKSHLNKDGIFIFDINSYYKLKHIIGNNTFVEDRDRIYYIWQNYFNNSNNIAEFYLTFFVTNEDENYTRFDEEHYQKAYYTEEIIELLKIAAFTEIYCFDGFTFSDPKEKSERIYFIALN